MNETDWMLISVALVAFLTGVASVVFVNECRKERRAKFVDAGQRERNSADAE